ncbi:MAG: hypothetical protein H6744_06395 [Deltaproteobacteria bacterium]|nr:hypothetical protein [Deltaproteobacteria bacterium]MCB9786310.1 hypothetical protein [Deltaproteobacteria bacterium]
MPGTAALRRSLSVGALLLAVAACPLAAAEPPAAEARAAALRDRGKAEYEAGNYREATRLFLEAYENFPNGWLLYNAARAQHKGGALEDAVASYRRFILSEDANQEYRDRAARYIAAIELKLHPPAPEPVEPESPPHSEPPLVEEPDEPDDLGTGAAAGGVTSAPLGAGLAATRQTGGGRSQRVAGWALGGLGVGLGVAGLLLHLDAAGTRSDVRDATNGAGVVSRDVLTQRQAADAASQADRRDTWAAVALGVGAGALVTGVVLLVRGHKVERTQVGLTPVRGGAVAGLRGSF